MPKVFREVIVPYRANQMYDLVNDVESYPQFIPYCVGAKILKQFDQAYEASLTFGAHGIQKTLITRNAIIEDQRIDLLLVEGPFQSLEGHWLFTPIDEHSCTVSLQLDYQFLHGLGHWFHPLFNRLSKNMVEYYCQRAKELYGHD